MGNKENGKLEEFKLDCPRRITVGDPSYFEKF